MWFSWETLEAMKSKFLKLLYKLFLVVKTHFSAAALFCFKLYFSKKSSTQYLYETYPDDPYTWKPVALFSFDNLM